MNDDPIQSLRELGWNSFFQEHFELMKVPGSVPARVISESKGSYQVYGQYGELTARISGKMRYHFGADNQSSATGHIGDYHHRPGTVNLPNIITLSSEKYSQMRFF